MDKKRRNILIIVIIVLLLIAILFSISILLSTNSNNDSTNNGYEIPDPSKDYCENNGYNYKIKNTVNGEKGICKFPDGSECDSWSYFCGCTNDSRYCARQYSPCDYDCK
ncbi:MAG: DUF333 domain-containing protein [Candidatus Lokiarchaeota archaeon]|nr:DUF333 domain-containing protein [Candidatus Lokiarchaeota archaeon]